MAVENKKEPPAPVEQQSTTKHFSRFAAKVSQWVGSSWMFFIAVGLIAVWGISGPVFHYSDTWQLIINTATTVVTFLVVFLIQNTQNRDARAIHLKLDEIIRSIHQAHNEMIDIEKLSDDELEQLAKHYERIREECDARKAGKALGTVKKKITA